MTPYQVVEQAVVVHQEALSGTQNITQLALFNEDGTPFSGEGISLTTPLTSLVVPQLPELVTASDTLIVAIGKLQSMLISLESSMSTILGDLNQRITALE